ARALTDMRIILDLAQRPKLAIDDIGPFFARFLVDGSPGEGEDLEVEENDVEAVIWSWEQEQELSGGAVPHVFMSFTGESGNVFCDPDAGRPPSEDSATFSFSVVNPTGAYQTGSRLRRRTVYTDQGLVLGTRGHHLELGSAVMVLAKELVIDADTIRVTAKSGEAAGIFAAHVSANTLSRVEAPADSLRVGTSNPPPLLRPYAKGSRGDTSESAVRRLFVDYSQFVDLRNVLMAFLPSMTGARSHINYVENRIIRGADFRSALLADLEKRKIIRREGQWFYLATSRLTDLGFGLMDVKSGEPGPAVLDYLASVKV
ncbi:hypothetical protein, partial [Nocardioides lentus]